MLTLPDALTPDDFLARHWQKAPLFLPQALPAGLPQLTADEVAWLATQDDVESRLVLTAGQMLLFLGIVTLVSGGIEQTTSTVEIQFEALNDHILRIERAVNFGNPTTQPMAAQSKYDTPSGPDSSSEAAA